MLFKKNNNIKKNSSVLIKNDDDYFWETEKENEIEGQLAIDVYQTKNKIIIKSTVAGVNPEDIKISLHNDLLTIKGSRGMKETVNDNDYLYQECYWGSFSRSIILPAEVDSQNVEAEIENGILAISLNKSKKENIKVKLKE